MTVTLRSRAGISLDAFYRVAWQGEAIALHQEAMAQMAGCREAFLRLIDSDEDIVVYGVTSGYGQMAHLRFAPEERRRHAGRAPGAPGPNADRVWRMIRARVFEHDRVSGETAERPAT